MTIGPGQFAVLSAIVFALGLYGVLSRRSGPAMLMALQLLLLASIIAMVGFTHLGGSGSTPALGDALAFILVIAIGSQTALGAALSLLLWRRRRTLDVDPGIER
jgi:NADH-quinone oxidoreductase subunit K